MKKLILLVLAAVLVLVGCHGRDETEPADGNDMEENTVTDEDGKQYASDRITVKFASEPTDEQIEELCQICEGEVRSRIGRNIVVLQFPKANIKRLNSLLKKISELDYVESASLDAVNQLN